MGPLKNFNKEQLTLGAAVLLSLLLLGWQSSRGKSGATGGPSNSSERVYSIPRLLPLDFADPKVDHYLAGHNIWEPPVTGRMPVPDLRPPEPRLEGPALIPFMPFQTFEQMNSKALAGKARVLPATPAAAIGTGLPAAADLDALKALKDPESIGVFDKRKQLIRPTGDSIIHKKDGKTLEGRIMVELPNGEVRMSKGSGASGQQVLVIKPEEIDRNFAGTDDGIERGWEFEKEYDRRSKKLADGDADGHLKLGKWLREVAGMLPEARTEFKAALDALKKKSDFGVKSRDALIHLGDVMRDLGDYDGAIAAYGDFIEAVRGSANETGELHSRLGDLFRALNILERAVISYQNGVQVEPSKQSIRIALARAQCEIGRDQEALDTIGGLLSSVGTGKVDPEAYTVQGMAYLKQGTAAAAQQSFIGALSAQPDSADALNGFGVALALQGLPDAGQKFVAAIKANPYLIDAWVNLGGLYLAAGNPAEAEVLFNQALLRSPDGAEPYAGLALVQILKGAAKDTGANFDKALQVHPKHFYVKYLQAHLALQSGKPQDALDAATESLQSEGSYLPAYYDAAVAYLFLAKEEERREKFGKPEEAPAHKEKAQSYRLNAETLLGTVKEMDPTRQMTFIALGCVYAAQGRPNEAKEAFSQGSMGGGMSSPLLEYGRAYVEYRFGTGGPKVRLDVADNLFSQGAAISPTDEIDKQWIAACRDAQEKIRDWNVKRVLVDERFDGNQWSTTANWLKLDYPNGPALKFENNRLTIAGKQGADRQGQITGLERRDISKDEFISYEGTFFLSQTTGLQAGVSLYVTAPTPAPEKASGIHFVMFEDTGAPGKPMKLYFGTQPGTLRKNGPMLNVQALEALPAGTSQVRVKIERRPDDPTTHTWVFDLYRWDDAKNDWKLLTEKNPMKLQPTAGPDPFIVTIFGRATSADQQWSFGLDDIRIIVGNRK